MDLVSSVKRREPPLRIPESMVKQVGDHVTFFFTREEFASLVRDHIDGLKTNVRLNRNRRLNSEEKAMQTNDEQTLTGPVEAIVMRDCICPRVRIEAKKGQVMESMQNQIAKDLCAMVELVHIDVPFSRRTVFGRHRLDCPCSR